MNSHKNKPFPFHSILQWYTKNGRHDLPWRQIYHLSIKERLYRVWIAEVMLQQTQVDRVIGYYTRFLEKYPTIESLAGTTYEELFPYYQGLGYYGRARRMIELAKTVVEKYNGIFPDEFEKLRKLPGIGVYTAQALLAFGYNKSILAIDANLEKIFSRYYFGAKRQKIQSTKYKVQNKGNDVVTQLQEQVSKENISGRDINNALMDFGALISTTFDKVDKDVYPLRECLWFQTEGKEEKRICVTPAKAGVHPKKAVMDSRRSLSAVVDRNDGTKYFCLVFLHENHKKYWSSHRKYYEPFLIEPIGKDDRKTVQDYFSATYGLEVSVRPSFGSGALIPGLKDPNPGIEVKLFHAQIQTGNSTLSEFRKTEKGNWISKNINIY